MIETPYRSQVDLLIQVLPFIDQEEIFALKGGTAINLFLRNMPRLSVDIDLNYLPFDERRKALSNISEGLKRIKRRIEANINDISVNTMPQRDGTLAKLDCQVSYASIKIEVNTTIRGYLFPTKRMWISKKVQNEFERYAEGTVLSKAELYGGKICAALDRQHPRDLFDVYYLLKNEGITAHIKDGFIAALLSHPRPIYELLSPNYQDQAEVFKTQFTGMTNSSFNYNDFKETRVSLLEELDKKIEDTDKKLLISFISGEPEWSLFKNEKIKELPAVQWKLRNIKKLIENNPRKHADVKKKLLELFK